MVGACTIRTCARVQPTCVDLWRAANGLRSDVGPPLHCNVLGLTVAVVGVGIAVSGIVDLIDGGPDVAALLLTGLVTWIVGSVVWRTTVLPSQIRVLDVFTTVTIAWVTIAAVGAIPYLVTGHFTRIDDALFEAMSGFTTTGATVTADIEATSKGLLFWRSMTQWMGGMGVIVLVVAVLPTVGSGGMSLLEAEAPGPTGERLTPRVRETARRLWAVYLGFTVLMATAYFVAGMSLFDAVSHSFTTVSTGGFSPYQGSFGHFESATLEWICIVGMMLAGGSFTLYWRALRGNVKPLLRSTEFRVYSAHGRRDDAVGLRHGGERRKPVDWISATRCSRCRRPSRRPGTSRPSTACGARLRNLCCSSRCRLGAMAGSTAGGIKVLRIMAVSSFAHREALKHLHPKLVRPVRVGNAMLSDDVAGKVVGFLILALVIFGGGSFAIAATGPDLITSFSASATSLGNVGPGLGALDHSLGISWSSRARVA